MLPRVPWKTEALLWVGCGLMVSLGIGGAVIGLLGGEEAGGFVQTLVGSLCLQWAAFLIVHLYLRAEGLRWRDAFGLRVGGWPLTLGVAAGAVVVVLPLAWTLQWICLQLLELLHLPTAAQRAVTVLQESTGVWPQVYILGVAVVVAPLAEELLFRGVLYAALRQQLRAVPWPAGARWARHQLPRWCRRHGYPRLAVRVRAGLGRAMAQGVPFAALLLSGIGFGAFHFHLPTFLPLAIFGVVLALLYEATGTLAAPMLTHSLFNLANAMLLLDGRTPS